MATLYPYPATALAINDSVGTGGNNTIASVEIVVYDLEGAVVVLYDDADGTNPESSKTTGGTGTVTIWLVAGRYRMTFDGGSDAYFSVGSDGIQEISTVADLRTTTASINGQQFTLLGHTNAGVGGGVFYYDESDTTSADDNGMAIVNADGQRFKRVDAVKRLSYFGAIANTVSTDAINSLLDGLVQGDDVIIDVPCTYDDEGSKVITVSDINIAWENDCEIYTSSLDYATSTPFLRFSGTYKAELTLSSGDISGGDNEVTFSDASSVAVGDLIYFQTDIYFNGVTGASGYAEVDKQELMRVNGVVGNTVTFDSGFIFDMPSANVANITVYTPINNIVITRPQLKGPGKQATLGNGEGSQGIFFEYGYNCHIGGNGHINAYQNRALAFKQCYYTSYIDLSFSSLESETTTSNFYGGIHEGGKFGLAQRCTGVNIRRVADTSSAGIAAFITHKDIVGTTCNGSAAGTHHCIFYEFENVVSDGDCGAGMTIRAKNTTGRKLILRGDVGIGLALGTTPDDDADLGTVSISEIDINAVASRGIRIDNNGSFELSANITKCQNTSIQVLANKIRKLHITGSFTESIDGISIEGSNMSQLDDVDISKCSFSGNTGEDINIKGTGFASAPAGAIKIKGNTSESSIDSMVVVSGGYFKGEVVEIADNKAFVGSDLNPVVDLGEPHYYSAAPMVYNNARYAGASDNSFTRDEQGVVIGKYETLLDIPEKTTALAGDVIKVINAGTSDYPEYQCVLAGTKGEITGVTGSISASSNELTLSGSDLTKVFKGAFLTISGAASGGSDMIARVSSISDDGVTATLSSNANTTVSGANVNYRNPEFAGKGVLSSSIEPVSA